MKTETKAKLKQKAVEAIIVSESWMDVYLAWMVSLEKPFTSLAVLVQVVAWVLLGVWLGR